MHAIDWICLGIVLASLLLGAWRGLLYESMSLAGWVLAYFAARWAASAVGHALPMGDSPEGLRVAAGFVLVFVGFVFLGSMLAWAARGAARALGLRPADRLFGAVFGAARGLLLLLVLAALAQMTTLRAAPWWHDSISGPWLQQALQRLQPWLPAALGQYLSA